ncbi:hypothetical protein JCM10212_000675 [Sporobolomyces blumeae]
MQHPHPRCGRVEFGLRRLLLYFVRSHHRHCRRRGSRTARPFNTYFRTPNLSGAFSRPRSIFREKCNRVPLLFFDERRRSQPRRVAHFRHAYRVISKEVAIHYGRTGRVTRSDLHQHYRWCPVWKCRETFAKPAGLGDETTGSSHSRWRSHAHGHHHHDRHYRHGQSHRDGDPFDYSTFRRAYWYNRANARGRPYNAHAEWRRKIKHQMPQHWVLRRPGAVRRRVGIAYFTLANSPDAKRYQFVEGRGGTGRVLPRRHDPWTARDALGRTSIARPRPYTALLRNVVRPRPWLPAPSAVPASSRAFSSSRPRRGLHLWLPLATALKSTEALHVLVWVTRVSLTLLPLSIRAKAIFALRQKYLRDPSSLGASIFSRIASACYAGSLAQSSSVLSRWNALFGLPFLLLSPLILLALVFLSSLEMTPVTGRWRLVMLSPSEESELVESILSIGRSAHSATTSHVHSGMTEPVAPEGTSLDWVAILRQILNLPDEGVDPDTGRRMLLGGVVLDQRDWRVRWTEAVLRALEQGVVEGLTRQGVGAKGEGEALRPPPVSHPLEGRTHAGSAAGWADELILSKHLETNTGNAHDSLKVEYDILVIDRDENNAFSFGFGPERESANGGGKASSERRGVIVVYTGFLNEVLGDTALPPGPQPTAPTPSSRFTSFFSRSSAASPVAPGSDPIASYLVPTTLPTQEQCKSLAVLLSHETAHLILDHTLESYASTNLLMPHLSRLTSDVVRTLLYPITAILGPFINDAVGRTLSEGAKGGFGIFGNAANSCESRKLESEADLVALRLLAGSGIDPRYALKFWEDRLTVSATSTPTGASLPSTTPPFSDTSRVHHHSKEGGSTTESTGILDGFIRTHPVDQERLDKIRRELESWERWNTNVSRRASRQPVVA